MILLGDNELFIGIPLQLKNLFLITLGEKNQATI